MGFGGPGNVEQGWGRSRLAASVAAAAALLAIGAAAPVAAQQGAKAGEARGVIVLRPTTAPAEPAAVTPAVAQPAIVTPALAAPAVAPAPAAVVPGRPTTPSPLMKACSRPFASTAASLGQDARFDRTLATALRARPASAVVDLAQPFAVDADTPAALTPWLGQVKASGGLVTAQEYCRESRGVFGFLRRLVSGGGQSAYKAAAGYDAVLHVDGLDQKVTQVEFRRRAP